MTGIGERRQAEGELAPGPPTTAGEIYEAAVNQARYVDNTFARRQAVEEAYDRRIDDVFKATGQRLDNPLRVQRLDLPEMDIYGQDQEEDPRVAMTRDFDKRIEQLGREFPDKHDLIRPSISVLDEARQKARDAESRLEGALSRYHGFPGTGTLTSLAGGMRGSLEDPVNLGTMFVGPAGGAGRGLKGLLWMGLKQGAANAAVETGMQPFVASWRKEAGLGYDASTFATNVGGAFAFGFGMDAGIRGAYRGVQHARGRIARTDDAGHVTGYERPEDALDRAAREGSMEKLKAAADGDTKALRQVAEDLGMIDQRGVRSTLDFLDDLDATDGRPHDIDIHEHDDYVAQIARALGEPHEPMPLRPEPVPEARGPSLADHVPLPTDPTPARAADVGTDVPAAVPKGNEPPIAQFRRDAATIEQGLPPVADGHTRLWRGNRDGEVGKATSFTTNLPGIALPFRKHYGGPLSYVDVPTERLPALVDKVAAAPGSEFTLPADLAAAAKPAASHAPTFRYDGRPIAVERGSGAGRALVLEDNGGRTIIDAPTNGAAAETLVFRTADGWDEATVRTLALRKRLQDGRADMIEAAAILRERPEVLDASVSLASAEMRAARSLAKLADQAFAAVFSGDADPRLGAMVADLAPPERHASILAAVSRAEPKTQAAARRMIGQLLDPPREPVLAPGMVDPRGAEADAQIAALEAGMGTIRRREIVHPRHPDMVLPLNAEGSVTLYRGEAPGKGHPSSRRIFTLDLDEARRIATVDGDVLVVHVTEERLDDVLPRFTLRGDRIGQEFFLPDDLVQASASMPEHIERRIALGAARAQAADAALAVRAALPDMSAIDIVPGAGPFEQGTIRILDAVRRGGLPEVEAEMGRMDRATARDAAGRLAGAHLRAWETLPNRYKAPLLAAGAVRRWAYAAEPGDLRARLLAAADDLDVLARVPEPARALDEPPPPPNLVAHPQHPDVKLPLREDGTVRLYRGERPDRPAKGQFGHLLYTADLERALRNVRAEGGILRVVDVPQERLGELDPRRSGDRREVKPGTDTFTLPEDMAASGRPVDGEALSLLDAATRAAAPPARQARPDADIRALSRLASAVEEGSVSHRRLVTLAQKAEADAIKAAPEIGIARHLDDVSALMRLKELMEVCKDA